MELYWTPVYKHNGLDGKKLTFWVALFLGGLLVWMVAGKAEVISMTWFQGAVLTSRRISWGGNRAGVWC